MREVRLRVGGVVVEVLASSRIPDAARLMRISEEDFPWPRPLGFWMEGRAMVAVRPAEGSLVERVEREMWMMLDQGVRSKPTSSMPRRGPER